MTDAKRTRGLELWQDFQARKGLARTRAELVLWFAQGQDIENFLAQLPNLPAGFLQEIQQYAQDPVGRKELRDVLFKGTYPGLHKVRKVVGGVDLFCDGIGLLVGRKEQSPDS